MNHDDEFATWDAAYVLGALPPDERRLYEDHVADCAACTARLAEIASLPGLLANTAMESSAAPVIPIPSYAAFAKKVRRRKARWVSAAAAAVLVIGAGAVALGPTVSTAFNDAGAGASHATATPTVIPSGGTQGVQSALHFTSTGQTSLTASGSVQSAPWGSTVSWTCSYASVSTNYAGAAQEYELVLVPRAGEPTVAATWWAGQGETVAPVTTTSLASNDISAVQIRLAGSEDILLTAKP